MKKEKSENKKALPLFLVILVLAFIVGGVIGFLAVRADGADWETAVKSGVSNFLCAITPWALIVLAVGLIVYAVVVIRRNRAQIALLQEDDEEGMRRIDQQLSVALALVSMVQIVSFFFMAALLVYMDAYFEAGKVILYVAGLVSFVVLLAAQIIATQKIVDLTKKLYPEKRGSVYDVKFQKKWYESCDEAERMQIAEASRAGFQGTQFACIALWLLFALLHMFLKTGILPVFAVSVVWLASTAAYYHKANRIGR